MYTIGKIQQFVENGGRFEKNREPAYGEPFHSDYMEQLVKRDYQIGDKLQVEMDDGVIYSGILMNAYWRYIKLIISGNKIWKNKKNLKDIRLENVKTITLVEKRKAQFDMDTVDPMCLYHKSQDEQDRDIDLQWDEKTDSRIRTRNKDKSEFESIYPDVPFEESHVICMIGGSSLYFPFKNNGVKAEIYLVQDNGMDAKKVECKTGMPYPNKNSYHTYNFNGNEYHDCRLYMYLPNAEIEYHDVSIVCVWTVNITDSDGKDKDIKYVNIYNIGTIEKQTDENNLHFIDMRISPILGFGDSLFTKECSSILERIMDKESVFILTEEKESQDGDHSIWQLKSSDNDEIYAFLALQALSHFNAKDMVASLMNSDDDISPIEVTVNCEDVAQGYFSSSWRNCKEGYKFKLLEKK